MRRFWEDKHHSRYTWRINSPLVWRGQRWLALSILPVVLASLSAPAQPALRNAVLNDEGAALRQQARAESFKDVEGVEAGPVRFSLNASYSLTFNDNVNTSSDDPEDDIIQEPAVQLGIDVPISERSDLSFNIGVGYRAYWHHDNLSRVTIAPGSELAYDLQIKDLSITFFDRFSYTEDVATAPDIANQTQFPRLENTIGTQAAWRPDRFLVAVGYSYQITLSTEDTFDYFNRVSHLPFLRAGYVFADGAANSGVEWSATFTDYESNITSDSTIVSFGPYLDWELSDAIDGRLRGGFLYTVNSLRLLPEDSFDANSFYVGLSVNHELTDYISHGISIEHGVRPSFQRGASFTKESSANYQISWAFMEPAVLRVGMGYVHGEQTLALGTMSLETYDQWRVGVGMSYELATRLSSVLAYDLFVRDSDRNRNYTQNRVTVGLRYRFN